jgi:hypothetical protein
MKLTALNLVLTFTLLFSACKKNEVATFEDPFIAKVKAYANTQLSEAALLQLDWSKLSIFDRQGKHEIVKIPLIGNVKGTDKSVYLKVVKESFEGNYFELDGNFAKTIVTNTSFDGHTTKLAEIENNIYDGNYKIFKDGKLYFDSKSIAVPTTASSIMQMQATYTYGNGLFVLINLLHLGSTNSNNSGHGQEEVQTFVDGGGGGGEITEIIEFEENDWEAKPAANITKIFNCFDVVPNGPNTTFEITLNADIPVNKDPNMPFFLKKANPGHVFLTIKKVNGSQSVTQNFGFYPNSGPKSLGLSNVSSKVVDDSNHEINASIKMNINDITFGLIRQEAIYFATQDYNLESNNCANFAMDLFNIGRLGADITTPPFSAQLDIPLLPSITATMAKSPQMLFARLNAMKTSGHPEAVNIQIDTTRGTNSGNSHGECQ